MGAARTDSPIDVLLVGDSKFLLELMAVNLAPLATEAILFGGKQASAWRQAAPTRIDGAASPFRLLVLALSRSYSEPVVILARVGLTDFVGVVPLVIVSDRPFPADPEQQIFHLSFPCQAHVFRQAVDKMLQGAALPVRHQRSKEHRV